MYDIGSIMWTGVGIADVGWWEMESKRGTCAHAVMNAMGHVEMLVSTNVILRLSYV